MNGPLELNPCWRCKVVRAKEPEKAQYTIACGGCTACFEGKAMTLENVKLSPCPYCGSDAKVIKGFDEGDYWVACANYECGARGSYHSTPAFAIRAWNRHERLPKICRCLHCGSLAETVQRASTLAFRVRCTNINCGAEGSSGFDNPRDAIEAWNTDAIAFASATLKMRLTLDM